MVADIKPNQTIKRSKRSNPINNQTIKNKIKSKVTLNELKKYDKKQEHAIIIHYTKLTDMTVKL